MATTNQSCTLFLKNAIQANPATIPLHTHGETESTGEPYGLITLFLAEGMEATGINDNISLSIKQGDLPTGTLTLYMRGRTVEQEEVRSIPLFLQQGVGPSDSISLYVKGLGVTDFPLNDSSGFNFHSDSITLMIERDTEGTTGTMTLFTEGQQTRTLTGSMPLYTEGKLGGSSYASLTLSLNSPPTAKLILYTRGY
jgi:hypothetical protein